VDRSLTERTPDEAIIAWLPLSNITPFGVYHSLAHPDGRCVNRQERSRLTRGDARHVRTKVTRGLVDDDRGRSGIRHEFRPESSNRSVRAGLLARGAPRAPGTKGIFRDRARRSDPCPALKVFDCVVARFVCRDAGFLADHTGR